MLFLANIKTSRIKNRVNLVFSDGNYLPFFIDDTIRLSLSKNQELNPEKLDQIKSLCLLYLGKEYALRQIAISPKTEKILFQKLKTFFYKKTQKFKLLLSTPSDLVINQIIGDLKEKKFLNQESFIDYFIKKNKYKSIAEIKYLLNQQGIDTTSLNLSSDNENQSIKKILSKKHLTRELLSDFSYKNKLYSSLFRKGFSVSSIKTAIDEYLSLQ
jgi:SOS response regulatory protein OraA/RecX